MRASIGWFFPLVLLVACGPSPALHEPEPSPPVEIASQGREPLARRSGPGFQSYGSHRLVAGTSYRGHYLCSQGDTNMTLQIDEVLRGGQVRGVFDFLHEPSGAHGSFTVEGHISPDGEITFEPIEWLVRPPRYVAVPFRLAISEDGLNARGGVLHPSCGSMEATRVER